MRRELVEVGVSLAPGILARHQIGVGDRRAADELDRQRAGLECSGIERMDGDRALGLGHRHRLDDEALGIGVVGAQPLLIVRDRLDQYGPRPRNAMQPRRHVVEQRAVAGADIDHLERSLGAAEPRAQRRLGQEFRALQRTARGRGRPWEDRATGRCAPGWKRNSWLISGDDLQGGGPPSIHACRCPQRHDRAGQQQERRQTGWENRCGCRGSERRRTLPARRAPSAASRMPARRSSR